MTTRGAEASRRIDPQPRRNGANRARYRDEAYSPRSAKPTPVRQRSSASPVESAQTRYSKPRQDPYRQPNRVPSRTAANARAPLPKNTQSVRTTTYSRSSAAKKPKPSRSRQTYNPYPAKPARQRPTTRVVPPSHPTSRLNPGPPRGAVLALISSIAALIAMFLISNMIGKNAANQSYVGATAAPAAIAQATAVPAVTVEPTSAPLFVYRTQPESTPYVSEELIQTIQSIQTEKNEPTIPPKQEEDVPPEGHQEEIAVAPPETYVTISDEPVFDESGRAGKPGDPVAIPLLVNGANRLSPEWNPDDMVYLNEYCPADVVRIKGMDIQGSQTAVDALLEMFRDAIAQGQSNWQVSAGYRSYNYQQSLLNTRVSEYMKNNGMSRANATSAALQYVAAPGASEHHTGLAFDITIPGWTFEATEQCAWLAKHCWEYGFIVRYTKDKVKITGIEAEPWHIRYVGKEHAKAMADAGLCLEEYVELLISQRAAQ
ncbi:MAG: D-alanyl-D-alanine carboxypeptidase family protein [Oscillospiraceae bacterium]|nr:D-alanyl-D-alanine carboxypeptidase family protein [Oscillospiraceae bacterium]